jgi:ketosteroid isomerase-like protein
MKTQYMTLIASTFLALSSAAMAGDAVDGQDRVLLSDLAQKWAAAYNRQDGSALAATYSPGAIDIHANGINRGREAIEKYFDAQFKAGFRDLTISIDTVRSAGGLVFSTGGWTVRLKDQTFRGYWSGVDAHDGNGLTIEERTSLLAEP